MNPLTFTISTRSRSSGARVGRVRTLHGEFDTPAFMPVGTRASVKGILPGLVRGSGAGIVLANTYHLLLRPGSDLIARRGGLHRFMNWDGPILTDSGGYQAFSMADMNSVDDDGVTFKSIIDGSQVRLTPERATAVQNELGADIIMAFDDCPPALPHPPDRDSPAADPRAARAHRRDTPVSGSPATDRLKTANERTVKWLERCVAAHARPNEQSLFGIVQGGTDLAAREWCARRITSVPLNGYAIGGVAVGESTEAIATVVSHTAPLLPEDKPRYLMGVGYERDLLSAVRSGVDMFDCVLPTRNGRNANAFTPTGQVRLRNARYAEDDGPLESGCDCEACNRCSQFDRKNQENHFSRAYIRHLFMAGEMLGPILVSLHNLRYFQRFMADIRATIASDDWGGFARRWPVSVAGL